MNTLDTILIINGPNLNMLGKREPNIYGNESFEQYYNTKLLPYYEHLEYFQSNYEGAIIDKLQQANECKNSIKGIVLNLGAYTHTSLAIADTLRAISIPIIEVHISNIFSREAIRRVSLISESCKGVIAGFGLQSYKLAIEALLEL